MAVAIAAAIAKITVTQVVLAVGSFVLQTVMANRAQKKAAGQFRADKEAQRAAYNASRVDRTTAVRTAVQPRNIVLGRDEVSGPIWPWFTYGAARNRHVFGVVLAGHECDAIETVLFNHEAVTLGSDGAVIAPAKYVRTSTHTYTRQFDGGPAGTTYTLDHVPTRVDTVSASSYYATGMRWSISGNVITQLQDSPTYIMSETTDWAYAPTFITYTVVLNEPLFYVRKYLGAPGQQAAPELVAAAAAAGVPGSWDATRKGTGVCYMTVTMEADFNVLGQIGLPNPSAIVRGVIAYDPRNGLPAWTQNPALLSRWLNVESIYAPETLPAEVNEAELIASANVCDEGKYFSADRYEARYTCNGQLTTAASPIDNFNHILDAMDGDAVWISGQWHIVAGYYREPTLELNEDTLSSANITVAPRTAKRDLFNAVAGTFIGPSTGYVRTSYGMVTSPVYQAQDNGELLPADVNFELVNDPVRCQMIAWQRLTRARQPLTVHLGTNLRGYDTAPLQTINVNLARLGFVNKVFVNRSREHDQNKLVHVLQETGPEVWNWDYTKASASVDLPNTSFPDVSSLPVPAGITFVTGSEALLRLENGSVISRALIRWAPVVNTYVTNNGHVEWQHKASSDTSDVWTSLPPANGSDTQIYTGPLTDGTLLLVRGRCVTGQGRQGRWSPIQTVTVLGKTADPTPPSAVAATRDLVIFTLSPDLDLAGYEVRYSPGAGTNGSVATPLHQGLVAGSPWLMPVRLYGVNTIFVRSVDDGGRVSTWVSDTQNFGIPDAANIADLVDFKAQGFPGVITDATVDDGELVAEPSPDVDYWGAGLGADFWDRDGAADLWGGSQYLRMVYLATYTSRFDGGAIFLDLSTSGARFTVECRVDGDPMGDFWGDDEGDGDFWEGAKFWGPEQTWQPWTGVLSPTDANVGIQFRVTIDAGSIQGVISSMAARTEMPTIEQSFGLVTIDEAGTTLYPADGLPPLTFIRVEDVQITPVAHPSGAIGGRVKGEALPSGITVELINGAAVAVTGPAYVRASGF